MEVASSRESRFLICLLHIILWSFSKLYHGVIGWNSMRRKRGLACPVISVGNIVLGGTGKTPAVEMLARMLTTMGCRVVILSRGYGRKAGKDTIDIGVVSDGKRILLGSEEGGDEPQLLAGNLPGVAVLVGKNRLLTGNHAIKNLGADVLILDDGFQYLTLKRELDVVVIDSSCPFGNGYLCPRGTLREPKSSLKRAHLLLLTHVDEAVELESLKEELRQFTNAPVVESVHSPVSLQNIVSGKFFGVESLRGRNIFALSSIGNHRSFERTLAGLGANVMDTFRFSDHHRYTSREIERILNLAHDTGVKTIVTTQKDAVRLEGIISTHSDMSQINLLALIVELKIIKGREVLEDMLKFQQ